MEPANLHHHHQQQQQQYHQVLQFQDHQLLHASSPSSSSSCYGVSTTSTTHAWTPCTIMNSGGSNFSSYSSGAINSTTNSRDSLLLRHQQQQSSGNTNTLVVSSLDMTQDLGFHWANNTNSTNTANNNSQLVKQESSSSDSFPRFTQMLKSPSSISSIEGRDHLLSDMNDKLFLSASGSQMINTGLQLYPQDLLYSSNSSNSSNTRGRFSQIYPTINVSNLNSAQASTLANSTSLDMNLQALDATYNGSFSHSYGLIDHSHHSSEMSISGFSNGVAEAKRTSDNLEPKAPQTAPKKSRLDSRAPYPPFKVRKEKLGDRIAALQQLVAPFGKTDTASVLMEAIGYIKFLQNQVETLSVPYMKSSRNKAIRTLHGGGGEMMNGSDEDVKRDLRSRGLCLVPLSCLSYVTDGVWPPLNFAGGT